MTVKYVFDETTQRMIPAGKANKRGDYDKISINGDLAKQLEAFAKEDGFDFTGISKVSLKNEDGTVKKDKDGNTVYQKEKDKDGNLVDKIVTVERSSAKVHNAIRTYTETAIKQFIAKRNSIEKE